MSVRRGPRARAARVATYVILAVVAVVVLFPFLVAVSLSLKEPKDAFTYPPSLVPRSDATGAVAGVDEPVPLVRLPGQPGVWGIVENGVSIGIFVPVADPTGPELRIVPSDVERVEGRTVVIDGDERDVYRSKADGTELARLRTAIGARFQQADDPTRTVVGLVSDSEAQTKVAPRWENFSEVLDRQNLYRSLSNTFLVTLLVVAGQVVTSLLGGYAFARMRFKGRDKLFLAYLGSVMIPFVVLIIPLYQLMVQLDWVDNLVALVIPFVFTAYGTFLMRQSFLSIPVEIEEAALLDGASRLRILWRIFVPLVRPSIATLATFSFLYAWNSFVWPLVVINSGSQDNFVLTLALQQLGGRASDSINLVFAGLVIAMTPPIAVFIAAQKHYTETSAGAGLK